MSYVLSPSIYLSHLSKEYTSFRTLISSQIGAAVTFDDLNWADNQLKVLALLEQKISFWDHDAIDYLRSSAIPTHSRMFSEKSNLFCYDKELEYLLDQKSASACYFMAGHKVQWNKAMVRAGQSPEFDCVDLDSEDLYERAFSREMGDHKNTLRRLYKFMEESANVEKHGAISSAHRWVFGINQGPRWWRANCALGLSFTEVFKPSYSVLPDIGVDRRGIVGNFNADTKEYEWLDFEVATNDVNGILPSIGFPDLRKLDWNDIFSIRLHPGIKDFRDVLKSISDGDTEVGTAILDGWYQALEVLDLLDFSKDEGLVRGTIANLPIPSGVPLPNPYAIYRDIKSAKRKSSARQAAPWITLLSFARSLQGE